MPSSYQMPYPSSILITGANRGYGFGLVKEYLSIPTVKHVFATARQPQNAQHLHSINDHRLTIIQMDVEDDKSIEEAKDKISSILGSNRLDLLINNAGIYENMTDWMNSSFSRDKLISSFNVNSIGPAIVSQVFLPLLRTSTKDSSEMADSAAVIINITSTMGSLNQNPYVRLGDSGKGAYAYMMSKAALNQMGKTMSIDLEKYNIFVVQINPGWIQTDMGGKDAAMTVEESASQLVSSISNLNSSHNGGFFNWKLEKIEY